MRNRQYFITNDPNIESIGDDFYRTDFGDFKIFNHKNLELFSSQNTDIKLCLLGFIIDPYSPEKSNQDVLNDLAQCASKLDFIKKMEGYSGRYVMVYKSNKESFVLNDCFGLRQIYYHFDNNLIYLSSSDKLMLDVLKIQPDIEIAKKKLLRSGQFLNVHEHWMLTETDWDSRLKKLLPNHYLDLAVKQPLRLPLFVSKGQNESEVMKNSILILQNSIKAALNRYKVMMPLTAGFDSRLLLAASFNNRDQINYFIFNRKGAYIKRDVHTAKSLAELFKLNFQIVQPDPLTEEFISDYKTKFTVARFLQKTQNIQWFKNNASNGLLNISGVGGELIRTFYDQAAFNSAEDILKTLELESYDIFKTAIEAWHSHTQNFASQYGLNESDLFYHEWRLGKWATKAMTDMDFANVEEYSPFNNKQLMYSILLNIPEHQRKAPYPFNKAVMEEMLPTSTSIPFNKKTWIDVIKSLVFYDRYKAIFQQLRYGKNRN